MLLYSVTLASLETISNYLSGFVTAQQVEFCLLMQRDDVKKITILVFQEGKNGNKNRFSQLNIRSHNQLNQILKKQNQSPKILPKRKTGNLYLLVSSHPGEKKYGPVERFELHLPFLDGLFIQIYSVFSRPAQYLLTD